MAAYFPPRLRVMSHLNRWGLMPLAHPDKVSSHSWFVSVYSLMVANMIRWEGDRGRLLTFALLHDLGELATGDICAPAKIAIVDDDREARYVRRIMCKTVPIPDSLLEDEPGDDIKHIVKVGDRLDDIFTVCMELAMGNTTMSPRYLPAMKRLETAWYALPVNSYTKLQELWDDRVFPSVQEHRNGAAYDFTE